MAIKRHFCQRCGHGWFPINEGKPNICPECKSSIWDKPKNPPIFDELDASKIYSLKEFLSLKLPPADYIWTYVCRKCGDKWYSETLPRPTKCPNCGQKVTKSTKKWPK